MLFCTAIVFYFMLDSLRAEFIELEPELKLFATAIYETNNFSSKKSDATRATLVTLLN